MSDVAHVASLVKENHPATVDGAGRKDRQLWGAKEIGQPIRRSPRQTNHLLQGGKIKCAKKIGGRWTCNEAALRREFGGEA